MLPRGRPKVGHLCTTQHNPGGTCDQKARIELDEWMAEVDTTLAGATVPPGGGRQPVTNRMLRHLHSPLFGERASEEAKGISNTVAAAFLQLGFGDEKKPPGALVNASVELCDLSLATLLPAPSASHGIFKLRDVSKVIQGECTADKRRVTEKDQLVQAQQHAESAPLGGGAAHHHSLAGGRSLAVGCSPLSAQPALKGCGAAVGLAAAEAPSCPYRHLSSARRPLTTCT